MSRTVEWTEPQCKMCMGFKRDAVHNPANTPSHRFTTKPHAPRDVYETYDEYRCGKCHQPVARFSAPRAHWEHGA